MIKQLAHACIHSSNLDATARFYFDTLGLEKGFEFTRDGNLFGFYVNLGSSTFIEVFQGKPAPGGTIHHLAIEVDDIDQVIQALRTAGYTATDKKLGVDHSWQCWTEDPSGVKVEFQQYTDQSLQHRGGRCEVNW